MNKDELLEQLKETIKVISTLKETMLKMCDDMDATTDIVEKETIRQAIIDCEKQMDEAETVYNELLEEIRK